MTPNDLRLTSLEATIAELRRERGEDRKLIREILSQVLALTEKQTQLLGEWTRMLAERRDALRVDRKPVSYTYTEGEEYRTYMEKHHPELLEADRETGYNSSDGSDRR